MNRPVSANSNRHVIANNKGGSFVAALALSLWNLPPLKTILWFSSGPRGIFSPWRKKSKWKTECSHWAVSRSRGILTSKSMQTWRQFMENYFQNARPSGAEHHSLSNFHKVMRQTAALEG
jgi:hypothetical protein